MCKHASAVLYAFGVMLDEQPELLFTLRGMDASALIPKAPEAVPGGEDALDKDAGPCRTCSALGWIDSRRRDVMALFRS